GGRREHLPPAGRGEEDGADCKGKSAECGVNADVEKHLELGKKLLAAGQLADALSQFHAAVDGDPDNYIAYYRRATVFLAMGKSKAALPDLTKVIELKMDFTAARLQRGHLLLKQGKLDEAEDDFKKVLKSNPSDNEEKEAQSQLMKSDEMQRLRSQALDAFESADYMAAISFLDKILEVCVWDAELRELRAECFIQEGEPRKAISDLKAASKLKNDNTEAFYKISTLYYQLGDHELSLSEVRECLKLDQDHKRCFAHYKQVKKLNKLIESAEELIRDGRYTDATSKYESVMKTEPNVVEYTIRSKERICHCFSKDEKPVEAIRICSEVLQMEPDNVNALKDRAEAYLIEEMYDEACFSCFGVVTLNRQQVVLSQLLAPEGGSGQGRQRLKMARWLPASGQTAGDLRWAGCLGRRRGGSDPSRSSLKRLQGLKLWITSGPGGAMCYRWRWQWLLWLRWWLLRCSGYPDRCDAPVVATAMLRMKSRLRCWGL
ncbi:dnaJ homolog subfamily C member 3, partial [Carlito syrichta]|uniref:DnaJ homolog subfamily C member 3 n=1 Tax=Carlito syrichta TaxID=1868482 RepID=A0A1U7UJG8_CARSF